MLNKPLRIGVTGGIGAGKSVVCQIFGLLGVPVYNADERAKVLMVREETVVASIKAKFGNGAYLIDGSLNSVFLANHVFKNNSRLRAINEIVHPAIAIDFERWSKNYTGQPYLIKEAALLVESNSYTMLDYLITVTAPVDIRIVRTLARDPHRTNVNVKEIVSKQLSDVDKISKSEFVITNDGQSLVIPQVLKINDFLISRAQTG